LSKRRTQRLLAFGVGLSLVAAACGDDDTESTDDTSAVEDTAGDTDAAEGTDAPATTAASEGTGAATTAPTETTGAAVTTAAGGTDTTAAAGTDTTAATETSAATETTATGDTTGDTAAAGEGGAMTLTVNLAENAVWEDGTPITVADLECTWQANLNTPGSVTTTGYDQITAVTAGDSDKQAVIEFSAVYGPYKTLFDRIIKAAAVENCEDISGDFSTEQPISARPMMLESWSESQSVFIPNPNYFGDDVAVSERVVMIPQVDQDTEVASLLSGQVDFIYPQFSDSIGAALQAENIEIGITAGNDYEAFYFQQFDGPFADPDFRAAFSMSIDREAVFQQIYGPIFESAGAEGELLNCGPIVPGPFCPEDNFQDTFDLAGAEALLTDAGWERNGEGFWALDGEAPEIRWMINAGNTRRENTQAFLIPLLAEAGFNVVPDNGTAEEVFQQRLPGLDYDMAMFITTPAPDPTTLVQGYICDQIPTEENNFQGANQVGWCNEEASELLLQSDTETDEDARIEQIHEALRLMDEDHVLLPLVAYPRSGAWLTDRVGEAVDAELGNYRAFSNFHLWEDLDGDGQVVLGAEQWPACLNPVTECANSSWMVWTVSFPTLPGLWDATAEQTFEITNVVDGEPVVEVSEGGAATATTTGDTEETTADTEETTADTDGATTTTGG